MSVPRLIGVPWKADVEIGSAAPTTDANSQIAITFTDLKTVKYAICDAGTVKAAFVSATGNIATFAVYEYAYAATATGAAVAYPASTALPAAVNAVGYGE